MSIVQRLNHSIYRAKYIFARELNHTKPVDISLELSSFCTNVCGYCYHADQKNLPFKKGHMDKYLAFKIIDQGAELGVNSLKTNYRGESTLNPHFAEITKRAKDHAKGKTYIDRITNSNFNFKIDRDDIFEGLCNQTKVKVSFDSFIPEVFEAQRKGSKFDKTIANINKFYDYPGRDNELIIQAVRTNLNKDEDLVWQVKKRWPSAGVSIRDCVEGRVEKDLSKTVVRHRDNSDRQSCIQAFARLMVNWDGVTTLCCPDIKSKQVVGNLNYETVYEVFNSEKAKEIRRALKDKTAFNNDPCKTCSSFESYKGYKASWNS